MSLLAALATIPSMPGLRLNVNETDLAVGAPDHWTLLAVCKPSAWRVEPLPVGSYPTDESVFGVRDLAGNVREWCRPGPQRELCVLRGGAWGLATEELFHAANRSEERRKNFVDTGTGFRLVKRPR